eukprot:6355830-Karenia_brevis.AAC.1
MAPELLTSMGFPITKQHQHASHTTCLFSRGHVAPTSRSRRSICHQVGNTIHINAVGAVHMSILMKLPSLGKVDSDKLAEHGKK